MAKKEIIKAKTITKASIGTGALLGIGGGQAVAAALNPITVGLLGSNPIGWLIGGGIAGAALLGSVSTVASKKGYSDGTDNTYRQFQSDEQEKEYLALAAKISQKDSAIALELLEKLPSEYQEFKLNAVDGLEKATMSSQEVIQMCCEVLGEDPNNYLQKNDFSLDDIAIVLKVSLLMILADGVIEDEEIAFTDNFIKEYFNLTQEEYDLIFDVVLNKELEEKMLSMTFEEIQVTLVSFFLSYNNPRLKRELLDILDDIANADGDLDANESKLWLIWYSLLKTEDRHPLYEPYLQELTQIQDLDYFTFKTDPEAFKKKVPNALNAYAKNIAFEHVLCLRDNTVFGKADEGFIVTPYAIITDDEEERVIVLSDIFDYEIDDDNLIVYSEPNEDGKLPYLASFFIGEYADDFIDFIDAISKINQEVFEDEQQTQTEETLSDVKEWHLALNNQQLGLHSLAEIDEKFANKELDSKDLLVWKDGMESWSNAENVESIAQIIEKYKVATPPPLPKV